MQGGPPGGTRRRSEALQVATELGALQPTWADAHRAHRDQRLWQTPWRQEAQAGGIPVLSAGPAGRGLCCRPGERHALLSRDGLGAHAQRRRPPTCTLDGTPLWALLPHRASTHSHLISFSGDTLKTQNSHNQLLLDGTDRSDLSGGRCVLLQKEVQAADKDMPCICPEASGGGGPMKYLGCK